VWKSNKPTKTIPPEPNAAPVFENILSGLEATDENYASRVVDRLLQAAIRARATDVHLDADRQETRVRWRVDGTLVDCGAIPKGSQSSVINRVKALARLVTYRSDVPQEGRLIIAEHNLEARVGTLPTLHGERAVIRLATGRTSLRTLDQLGLDGERYEELKKSLEMSSGVLLICGPAGSGKTTTAYGCLRRLVENEGRRSLVSLEDPIEIEVPGVAQSQINPAVGYDWTSGLKALLRQDPEVMLVGEIRDAATAAMVFDAALTGQLVISTMHARGAADAVRRLLDMQVPTHHLFSGLNLLWCQRLLRKLCDCQQRAAEEDVSWVCPACGNSGYYGRLLLTESFPRIEKDLARAVLADASSRQLHDLAQASGMRSLEDLAAAAVAAKLSTAVEFKRHFTS
jgi:general secretion pathway protein E